MSNKLDDGQFVERLTSCQARLRAYAIMLVRSPTDADDIMQNACLTLWDKREDYDRSRDFFPWACGVILIEVLRFRRKRATEKLLFDEALINSLAEDFIAQSAEYDSRREQLHHCVAKLSEQDRDLLTDRYRLNVKPKKLSKLRGWPVSTVYSALTRIRESLYRCIEANLAQQSHFE